MAKQMLLARYQPCGCILCSCENEENKCRGCGTKHCGNHALGELPNPVYDLKPPTLEEHDKHTRAEVLAAGIAKLGDLIVSRQGAAIKASKDGKEGLAQIFVDERDGIKSAIRALKELQPAASDLEALLEEARREERVEEHDIVCPICSGNEGECWRRKELLEKARAEGK